MSTKTYLTFPEAFASMIFGNRVYREGKTRPIYVGEIRGKNTFLEMPAYRADKPSVYVLTPDDIAAHDWVLAVRPFYFEDKSEPDPGSVAWELEDKQALAKLRAVLTQEELTRMGFEEPALPEGPIPVRRGYVESPNSVVKKADRKPGKEEQQEARNVQLSFTVLNAIGHLTGEHEK